MWGLLSRKIPKVERDPRSGIMTQHLSPAYGACGRCRTAWKFVDGHTTHYGDEGGGCFPLCELCWSEMTPTERLPFYYSLYRQWEWDAQQRGDKPPSNWEVIEHAVLNEESPNDKRVVSGRTGS